MPIEWTTALPYLLVAAVPLLVAACTSFTKVAVVLAAVRVGLSAENLFPYVALLALTLAITGVTMAPVGHEMLLAWQAVGEGAAAPADPTSLLAVLEPLRSFMVRFADADEVAFFADLAGLSSDHVLALVPAFLVGELTAGLGVAVAILVPFVLVDLLVAQVLTLCGLSLPNLTTVTLPLKVSLFLAAGGFELVIANLVAGYVA